MESNFRSLRYFIVTAEEMNFTRAARTLYITQQSLSTHIKKLEEQYEVTLFERRPVLRLTLAGERLLKYAKHVIAEEKHFFDDCKRIHNIGKIRLPIGVPTIRSTPYLAEITHAYMQMHPNIITSYIPYGYSAADAALRTKELDLYFASMDSASNFGKRLPILRDDLYFIINKDLLIEIAKDDWQEFLRRHADGISVADTIDFPVVLPPRISSLRAMIDSRYDNASYSPHIIAEVIDKHVSFDMCARGVCGGFLSKSLLYKMPYEYIDTPLFALHVSDLADLSYLGIVYSGSSDIQQYVKDYIDCAHDIILSASASMDTYLSSLILTKNK